MYCNCWFFFLLAAQVSSTFGMIATATYGARATAAMYLFQRDDTCPSNTFQCSEDLGEDFNGVCCQNGQTCARDNNDNPACCPSGAVCTGTAPATAATAAATAAPSYVPNSYFSFPYAPTTYASEGACKSAVKACSQNYDACVADLGDGETYGVTIAVPDGGGVTVGGSGATLGASATPICSSLSSRACSDLDKLDCGDFGSGSNAIQGRRADLRVLVGFAGTFLALTLFA